MADLLRDQIIQALNDADGNIESATDLLVSRMERLAQNGNEAAIAQNHRKMTNGYHAAVKGFRRSQEGRLFVMAHQYPHSVPAAKAVHHRSVDGSVIQLVLPMVDLVFADLRQKLLELLAQRTHLADSLDAIGRLLELQTRVPEARTPNEALKALGMTVEEWLAA